MSFDTGGYLGALFSRDQAMSLFTDGTHYSAVDVSRRRPASRSRRSTAAIAKMLPGDLEAKTGKQVRDADTQGVADALSFITYILLGFGIIALLVGTFIIYNTFSMIVAQRQRELALLRAIGASSKQVRRSVVLRGRGDRLPRQRARPRRRRRAGLRAARAARRPRPRAAGRRSRALARAR